MLTYEYEDSALESYDQQITMHIPLQLNQELRGVKLGAATPRDVYPRDILSALGKVEFAGKYISI